MVRNFYGCLTVRDSGSLRVLTHGTINHGQQFIDSARRGWPTAYYGESSGIGMAVRQKQKTGALRVGVVGLGAGTLAAYSRAGDAYRFYEINPLVERIAESNFSFLRDSKAAVEVVIGDGRLSLEREAPQGFDVLAVDAFSGDSIPIHLLTREAMALYFRHLKADGVLAVHITNRYLDLRPVLAGEGTAMGKLVRVVDSPPDAVRGVFGASWALLSSLDAGLGEEVMRHSISVRSAGTVRLWTDGYSNLFQILK